MAKHWHPPISLAAHGPLAFVTPGVGLNGWPSGYWGAHGSGGKRNESQGFPVEASGPMPLLHRLVLNRRIACADLKDQFIGRSVPVGEELSFAVHAPRRCSEVECE